MSRVEWKPDQGEMGWNSGCGRYRIVRCPNCFAEGYYYKLYWLGSYGQTCQREYSNLADAKRSATMRARAMDVVV